MKFSTILFALIATASAMPHGKHFYASEDPASTVGTTSAVISAAAATDSPTNQRGHHHTDSSSFPSQAPAQATAAPSATAATASSRASQTASGSATGSGSVNPDLVPDFGQQAGLQPDGTGNCKADSGKTIPCQCPPDRAAFIAKLSQFISVGNILGAPIKFPTGSSDGDALARIDTIISTLQNFDGKVGQGCPAASAPNFSAVQCTLLRATGGTCNAPVAGG